MDAEELLFEKYKLLIQARNFHYENYSKWMTYFYLAMAAVFVGYYNVISKPNIDNGVLFMILLLGFIISLFWYWSSKGYYYWNINFIMLVNYYEKELLKFRKEASIYSVFANKNTQNNYESPISGANISTSKVAILFSFIVSCFWGTLFINYCLNCFLECHCHSFLIYLVSAIISGFLIILFTDTIASKYLYSYIDHMPDLNIEQKKLEEDKEDKPR